MSEEVIKTEQFLKLPMITLRGMTVMPESVIHVDLNKERTIQALEASMLKQGKVFLVSQKDLNAEEPSFEQLYHVGTIAQVKQITKLPNRLVRVLVEGLCRGILHRISEESGHFPEAVVEEIVSEEADEDEEIRREAMLRQLKELFRTFAAHYPKLDKNASQRYARVDDLEKLIDQITMNLPVGFEHKQLVLEILELDQRYETLAGILQREIEIARAREEIGQKVKGRVENKIGRAHV